MMTSKSLFNPEHEDDDNLQIEHMIQLLGPFPLDVIAAGKRSGDFFTSEGAFRKHVQFVGLTALVKYALPPDQDPQDVDLLISFLGQMLTLRSTERAEALELISHPWLVKTTEEYMARLVAAAEAPGPT
ncbi:serine/threonine protein kinase, CMGC [Tulasnella sp. JGI-2019a]|nr:serine/threonine protein kinase, CMGC [Tulasnella sp. JGI-2019a]